jgi:hypothetical protein
MVAVHLTNHSALRLAKIDGSSEYKSFMRREKWPPPNVPLSSVQGIWPGKPDTDAARFMIEALKSSAGAYLSTTFCFVDIAMPVARQGNYQKEIFEAAVRASGLRQPHPAQSAGNVAVGANDPKDVELPDGQIVLAIDYSLSGLNLDLICDDAGIVDGLRHEYAQGIGADNPNPAHWDKVSAAIEKILLRPFPDCPSFERTGHKTLNHIVLYGDSVDNKEFLQLITRILGTDLVTRARAWEPEFGVALSLAENSYQRQNSIDFKGQAALGCRWRSGLYSAEAEL